ncbi:alpha/beta fold hydrolase [Paenisporosarcina sp. TG-14]|uniref:alpha/beta fold hydrolase n=1 Tax=Paenisporosarcina sp. TG-14 TaxID=1231057 RepID=UPI0002D61242|nr:alpha/beta hydrolase [Paenisporosarcina sp. TG-14]
MSEFLIGNEKLVYDDLGSGIPILFIPPVGLGRKFFYEQKPLTKYFRLILPDLIGQGDSKYKGESEITIARFAKDIILLMDHLHLSSVVLFSYSSGGTIAQYLCIHYPSRIKSLIMSGGYPIITNFPFKIEHRLGILSVRLHKKLVSNVISIAHTKNNEYRNILKEHMYKSDSRVWSQLYVECLHFNCKVEIKKTEIPILLLYGSQEYMLKSIIKFYKKNLKHFQLFTLKGVSHHLPTKASSEVNQIVTGYLLSNL